MNLFANRISSIAMAAAFICGTALSASAQQGSFHLPFEAKWSGVVCPPGDYRVSLPDRPVGSAILLVRGPAGASFVLPMIADVYGPHTQAVSASLQLIKVDGEYFVKKYEAGSGGLIFYFKTPKPSHRVQITANEAISLPVSGD
jgi:hypothetical protein